MPRSYRKNIIRTFRGTKSRFIAIFSIVALGVGFLAGLMSTTPDMRDSMETYLDSANFYDLRVVSTLGLSEADIDALRAVEGVRQVQPGYAQDLLVAFGDDTLVARARDLPDPDDPDAVDRLTLEEGRWPAAPGECVVAMGTGSLRAGGPQVGDTFAASPDNEDLSESLAVTRFTVVGRVRSANYFSIEREAASVGDGSVAILFYIQPSDFSYEVYTDAYLTVDGAFELASLSQTYKDTVEAVEDRVEVLEAARAPARLEEIRADARAELDDGWAEYNDARAEADEEFAKAEQELADARQELADGERDYADGQQEQADAEKEVADGEKELADAENELINGENELAEGKRKLEDGRRELADAERQLADAQAQYDEGAARLADGQRQLDEAQRQLDEGQRQLDEGQRQFDEGQRQLDEGQRQFDAGQQQLDAAQRQLEDGEAEYAAGEAEYAAGEARYTESEAAYTAGEAAYAAGEAAYTAGKAEYEQGAQALAEAKAELDDGEEQYRQLVELRDGLQQYDADVQRIIDAAAAADPAAPPMTVEQAEATFSDDALAGLQAQLAGLEQLAVLDEQQAAAKAAYTAAEEAAEAAGADPEQDGTVQAARAAWQQADAAWLAALQAAAEQAGYTGLDLSKPLLRNLAETYARGQVEKLPEYREQLAALTALNAAQKRLTVGLEELGKAQDPPLGPAQAKELLYSDAYLPGLRARLDEGKKQYEDGMAELETSRAELDAARTELDASRAELDAARTELEAGRAELDGARAGLEQGRAELEQGRTELEQGRAELDARRTELEAGRAELETSRTELEAGKKQLEAGRAELEAGKKELDEQAEVFYQGKRELQAAKAQLDEGYAGLEQGRAELAGAEQTVLDSENALAAGRQELADGRRELEDGRRELADGKVELADAWQKILDGRAELADGEAEYAEKRADAEAELADARAELEDGEAELADLEAPEWYIWDRSANTSFHSFEGNVNKVEAIARVFPIFFFLVAALVVSTTMTRMVEEERLQIGTMKAMGYARPAIMQKYIWYALTAAVLGALAGLALGFTVFPSVIWYAYEMMYYMPHLSTPWRSNYATMAGGLLIGCALVTTLSACQATLRETPADLMRPRAPRAGKRIFLERITPLWRRLPFTYKVTCRNLLRYKRRFWMTVLGVAGCTALLVTGFGISDSLNGIAIKQYGDIYKYHLLTAVTDSADTQRGAVHDYLFSDGAFTGSLAVSTALVNQQMPDGSLNEVYLMTPQDAAAFGRFVDLRERVSRAPTPLTEDGVILTEKLADTMGVKAGDTVTFENADGQKAAFTVTGVCEHYVMNYAYIGPAAWRAAYGAAPDYNAVLSLLADDGAEAHAAISARLLGMDGVAAVNFTTDQRTAVLNMLNSINAVVVLIIVCAASLAFVVLYNLTNINIAERVKEIATIKVLGFYDREVAAYVNRESVALTVIGALLGLLGGIALHKFVIYTVEVDAVMFGRTIEPMSFVYALALTMLFSTLVNLVMGRKLKKISMVESMKAPE